VLAGIIQILAGLFKLGKLMRIVPHPVIYGFVNGLAIIFFMSQLNQFKDASGNWLTGQSLYILVGLVLLTYHLGLNTQKYPCFINCNFLFWN
jgi:SulP family sulfate permease